MLTARRARELGCPRQEEEGEAEPRLGRGLDASELVRVPEQAEDPGIDTVLAMRAANLPRSLPIRLRV
jgi:hypothetical protein